MRNALASNPTQVRTGNVFEYFGLPPDKALALKFKAKILTGILDEVCRKKYRQGNLVEVLDEHQPVVSNLLQGKISQMSIEKLLIYADRLGLRLDIQRARPLRRRQRVALTAERADGVGQNCRGQILAQNRGQTRPKISK